MRNVQVHGQRFNNLQKVPSAMLGMWSMMSEDFGLIQFNVMEGGTRIWTIEKAPTNVDGHLMLPNPPTIYLAYQKLKDLTTT